MFATNYKMSLNSRVFCRSNVCRSSSLVPQPVTPSPCLRHHTSEQYRCPRCNRVVVQCLTCPGHPAFTISVSNENSLYSHHAKAHFESPEHLRSECPPPMVPPGNASVNIIGPSRPHSLASHVVPAAADDDDDNFGVSHVSDEPLSAQACSSVDDLLSSLKAVATDPGLSEFPRLFSGMADSVSQFFAAEHENARKGDHECCKHFSASIRRFCPSQRVRNGSSHAATSNRLEAWN